MKPNIQEELKEAKAWLIEQWYNVCFIAVYGSQNYWLDVYSEEYTSDIDFKAVVIPSLDELVHNTKPMSTTLVYKDGQIDIKDIRVFMTTVVKCNPAYLEVFFTEYSLSSDEFKPMLELAPELVKEQGIFLLKACYGMIKEKEKAFSHPYPTIAHKIEKYGYDPKQLHHIVRLASLMTKYINGDWFDVSNAEGVKKDLMVIKLWGLNLWEAEKIRDAFVVATRALLDSYDVSPTFTTKSEMTTLSREIIMKDIYSKIANNGE